MADSAISGLPAATVGATTDEYASNEAGTTKKKTPPLIVAGSVAASGILARTSNAAVAARTITAGDGIGVTAGDGVAGNPTIAVAADVVRDADIGSLVQAWDTILDALAAIAGGTNGLLAKTGAATAAARTITAPAAGISVSNGDGVSGNPTLALANDLSAVEGLATTGVAVRTAADTWTTRTLTAGSGISIADGDGVAGNPTITATGGTPGEPSLTAPVLGDFTAVNQGSATATTQNSAVLLKAPRTASANVHLWKKAAPATPYTITVKLRPMITASEFAACGVAFRNAAGGTLAAFMYIADTLSSSGYRIQNSKFNSPTSFNASYDLGGGATNFNWQPTDSLWMKLEDDGTNRKVHISANGSTWTQIHSVGRTDFLTADEVGVFVYSSYGANYPDMQANWLHWAAA